MSVEVNTSLATINPRLSGEWHPSKNGALTPSDISHLSKQKVWWLCSKNSTHEWGATVYSRNRGHGCPCCSGKKAHLTNCLATLNPTLSAEWHPTRNGFLTPYDVTTGTKKKYWWQCPKNTIHTWEASPKNRRKDCPICSKQDNLLVAVHPELSKEWDFFKNKELNVDLKTVSSGSNQSVWWICLKNPIHQWNMKICLRSRGYSCPFCAGKRVSSDNSLEAKNPILATEWHPTKNNNLKPSDFTANSDKRIWWLCKKNKTHEWEATIKNRHAHKSRCPSCFGNTTLTDERTFGVKHPKLVAEWHPTKNADLTPYKVFYGSQKKVWWLCGEGHEWEAPILTRTSGHGCPSCSGRIVTPERSLAVLHPELAKEWHSENKLAPNHVSHGSHRKILWQCPRNPSHTWEASICSRVDTQRKKGTGCPDCHPQVSEPEQRLAAELEVIFPSLKQNRKIESEEADIYISELTLIIEIDGAYYHKAARRVEKDKQKNMTWEKHGYTVMRLRGHGLKRMSEYDINFDCSKLQPEDVLKVLENIVHIDNIHKKLSEEVKQKTKDMIVFYDVEKKFSNNDGFYVKRTALAGALKERNFKEQCPELVEEWHTTKNYNLRPEDFLVCSNKKVWWQCKNGHAFQAEIVARYNKKGKCVECRSIAFVNPGLANEWHPTKNHSATPSDVKVGSNKNVWWQCSKKHAFQASPDRRHRENSKCPRCLGRQVFQENCLAITNKQLSSEWHPLKNGGLTPNDVTSGSNKKVWWKCPKNGEHEWEAKVGSRSRGNKCPICSGKKIHVSNCLATINKKLSSEWHPLKNGDFTPNDVTPGSKKKVWWQCQCGHEYQSIILSRSHGHSCPECAREKKRETAHKRWAKYKENLKI